ncbi:FecR family protein [Chitinophaga eiseniae]|uniref:DUF4974 domain-containing protein n=1 Tax=Chitinophaga eiseniae TaxID=634771 RepID=A0A847SRK8_9BACT|nr:FecR family protein [Chitinophaga eiseniae]NLR80136.1 DUF4974 domain-containing protein [Chitinophaga eiseniae]
METTKDHIEHLWKKFLSNEATKAEVEMLLEYIDTASDGDPDWNIINEGFLKEDVLQHGFVGMDDDQRENLLRNLRKTTSVNSDPPVHRVHFLRTSWLKYAAAVLLICGVGAYFWTINRHRNDLATTSRKKLLQTDIAPGGEKAVLTLADGTKITLDSASNGNLAKQGDAQVVKLANGQIAYEVKGLSEKDILWNTMSTPNGGQYQVTLPDGTRVWLNAASSITYPVAFVGKERHVKVSGEAYFEVAQNREKPFTVDVDGKSVVEVLGTSFNVNSYRNEATVKTTLVDGAVNVKAGDKVVKLRPGQQAAIGNTTGIAVLSNADITKTLAWKNGEFNFDGVDLQTVMRQLERWYGISVRYQGTPPDITFRGGMYRNVNLSVVLEFLQNMGVKFRMDGKTLIVTN